MAVQALQSSGVGLRRILAHFPEDLSLAFAYGSAVYRQAGPNAHQEVSPQTCAFATSLRPGICSPSPVPLCLPSPRSPRHARHQLVKCSSYQSDLGVSWIKGFSRSELAGTHHVFQVGLELTVLALKARAATPSKYIC